MIKYKYERIQMRGTYGVTQRGRLEVKIVIISSDIPSLYNSIREGSYMIYISTYKYLINNYIIIYINNA